MDIKLDAKSKILSIQVGQLKYDFDMLKKRFTSDNIFYGTQHVISYAFRKNSKLFVDYIKIKKIYTKYNVSLDDFIELLHEHIFTNTMKILSKMYVDEYQVIHEIKSNSDSNVVVNEKLVVSSDQITDLHNISFVMKMIIPIIGDYISMTNVYDAKGNLMKDDDIFYQINVHVMNLYNERNIVDKLYNFIQARVIGTSFEHMGMWNMLKNINVTQATSIVLIYEVIVKNLYKLDVAKYPIYLIHSIVNQQVTFVIRQEIKIKRIPMVGFRESRDGANGSSLYEKIEGTIKRKDEGLLILDEANKISKLKEIFKFFKMEGISITKEELMYVDEHVRINSFQMTICLLFYSKYVKSHYFDMSKAEYLLLLTMIYKWVATQPKFKFLHKVLLAEVDESARKSVVKKAYVHRLNETKMYQDIINTKFNLIKGKFNDRNNPFLNLINYMNNKFYVLPSYQAYLVNKDVLNNREYLEVNKDIDEASYEFLLFLKDVI